MPVHTAGATRELSRPSIPPFVYPACRSCGRGGEARPDTTNTRNVCHPDERVRFSICCRDRTSIRQRCYATGTDTLNIEDLRDMIEHHTDYLFTAPSGKGDGMPAAGAPSLQWSIRATWTTDSTPVLSGDEIKAYATRMDRLGTVGRRYTLLSAPPLYRSGSNSVPFSPPNPSIYHNLFISYTLTVTNPGGSPSNHLAVTVEEDTSTLNICARNDGSAADGIPGHSRHINPGQIPSKPENGRRRSNRCTQTRKGTLSWPRRLNRSCRT